MTIIRQMLFLIDEFMEYIEEQEIEFEGMEIALLKNEIERIERKNKTWLQN